jgi:hypothetical protein
MIPLRFRPAQVGSALRSQRETIAETSEFDHKNHQGFYTIRQVQTGVLVILPRVEKAESGDRACVRLTFIFAARGPKTRSLPVTLNSCASAESRRPLVGLRRLAHGLIKWRYVRLVSGFLQDEFWRH